MPELVFLTERRPLVTKTAEWLLAQAAPGRPVDLSATAVILATAGASRRLGDELLRHATALLPPLFSLPLKFLDRSLETEPATPQERLAAWSRALREHSDIAVQLLPAFSSPLSVGDSLRVARSLAEISSLLAEAGLTPVGLATHLPQDEDRWALIAELYTAYLQQLARHDLSDPNELRIALAEEGTPPPGFQHLVVAAVPDLNVLVRRYLTAVERQGIRVTVLVDAVDCEDAVFDAWGTPDLADWSTRHLPIREEDIVAAADAFSEAETVSSLLNQNAALCLASEELATPLQSAFARRGREVFNPQGQSLATSEIATIAAAWLTFTQSQLVADLRLLVECPVFQVAVSKSAALVPMETQIAFDHLAEDTLLDHWPDVVAFIRAESNHESAWLVMEIEKLRTSFDALPLAEGLPAFLEQLYEGHAIADDSDEAAAVREYSATMRELFAARNLQPNLARELLRDAVAARTLYARHEPDAVELNGWLEAPWFRESCVVLTGCVEGALPAATTGHAFLPDSARLALGLATNASRLARDSFLLHTLLASRPAGQVKLVYGRETPSGDPTKPSRLLFRCPDPELPPRIRHLFREVSTLRHAPARKRGWRLDLPRTTSDPVKLRVTGFGDYLACPLRYYLKHILRTGSVESRPAEMDARQYGTALHRIVEDFAKDTEIRDSRDEREIERFVLKSLDRLIAARHGRQPSLPVRVQKESLAARLRHFARLQALERENGWRIEAAELPFLREDTLVLSGIPITASLDRVERHEKTGQRRILDYKTFARDKSPEQTHLGSRSQEPFMPGEEVFWNGKFAYWKNLQLPLYRALAEYKWPGEEPPITGYFLLPERAEDSRVEDFALDDFTFHAALQCAEAIAERVQRGIFWPPREVEFDDFTHLFLGENPADVLSEESIAFLQGGTP